MKRTLTRLELARALSRFTPTQAGPSCKAIGPVAGLGEYEGGARRVSLCVCGWWHQVWVTANWPGQLRFAAGPPKPGRFSSS